MQMTLVYILAYGIFRNIMFKILLQQLTLLYS